MTAGVTLVNIHFFLKLICVMIHVKLLINVRNNEYLYTLAFVLPLQASPAPSMYYSEEKVILRKF